MAWWAPVAAQLGGSLLGGLLGSSQSSAAQEQADAMFQKAIAEMEKIGVPSVEAQEILLQTPELVYDYVPEEEISAVMQDTEMAGIESDPRLRETQMDVLNQMQDRTQEGLSDIDQAAINDMRRQIGQQEQSRQKGIEQKMHSQGMGGSGMDQLNRLVSSQESANRASMEGDQLAAMNVEARQQAVGDLGNYSGNLRQQDFSEASEKAQAQDMINQFNTQNQMSVQQRNTAAKNQAMRDQAYQAQLNANTAANVANTQEQYNKGLIGQNYNQQLAKANAMSGAYGSQGQQQLNYGQNQASNTYNAFSGMGSGVAGLYSAYDKYQDKENKKDS